MNHTTHHARTLGVAVLTAGTLLLPLAGPAGATRAPRARVDRVAHPATVAGVGRILVDARGYALYTYGPDGRDRSTCTGSCLAAWPALTVPAHERPTGVPGLGAFARAKDVRQVAWRGHPLYTYVGDTRPDEVTGNGVAGFHVVVLSAPRHTTTTTTHPTSGY